MQLSSYRTQRFRKHNASATVQKSDRLGISLYRHAADKSFRGGLQNLDPHLLIKGATSAFANQL
jgi:hypothetical protein